MRVHVNISNKVISSLRTLLRKDRKTYEEKWDTIKLFINLGIVTIPELYQKAEDILLLTDIHDKKYTLEEYYDLIKDNQTDKDGHTVYLYTYNKNMQHTYIEKLEKLNYNILWFNDQYSSYEIQAYEMGLKEKNAIFKRIDSDIPDKLIEKEDTSKKKEMNSSLKSMLTVMFEATDRKIEKINMQFEVQSLGKEELPITIIANEYFRRIKEMSMINNQGYFIDKDDMIILVLNSDSKLIKKIIKNAEKSIGDEVNKINDELATLNRTKNDESDEDKKDELTKKIDELLDKKKSVITEYAKTDEHINEAIDIALLECGLLSGENMSNFIKRSYKIIEK